MEVQKKEEKKLQWHPAFYAGIQIELQEEAENLVFENEHQLGTKPKEIDVLVVKKEKEKPIKKNIGRIFRKYNIIEYKSPDDYLSIDVFYKVYGYSCFYKSDTEQQNSIPMDSITITLVSARYPRKLIQHLRKERDYEVRKEDAGIYYVIGDYIPIQIIVTNQLSKEENLWLRGLTNHIKDQKLPEDLIKEYGKHKENVLYQSVMNLIVSANVERFKGDGAMCEALYEIAKEKLKDEFEAVEKNATEAGEKAGREAATELTKSIFKLHIAGKTPEEIAEQCGIPVAEVEKILE